MDNAYFIGYRIDIKNVDFKEWATAELFEEYDIDEFFPNSEWMAFSNPGGGYSLLWMGDKKLDYRCPIDRSELWEDLHDRTFDFPEDGIEMYQELCETGLYQTLLNAYGDDDVVLRWGIFLCLG